jgi:hypothetical protein
MWDELDRSTSRTKNPHFTKDGSASFKSKRGPHVSCSWRAAGGQGGCNRGCDHFCMFERCECSFGPESSQADMYKPVPLLQQLRIPHFLEVDMTASGGHQRIQRAKRPRDLKENLNSFARPASSSSSLPLGAVNSTVCCITARSTPRSALTSGFRHFSVLALVSVGLCPPRCFGRISKGTNERTSDSTSWLGHSISGASLVV